MIEVAGEEWITISEAAEIIMCSPTTVRTLVRNRTLKSYRATCTGKGKILIGKASVVAYKESRIALPSTNGKQRADLSP